MTPYQSPAVKLVLSAFSKLHFLNNKSWRSHREIVLKMAIAEEKQHRSGDFAKYHPNALSVSDCACALIVKRIAEYLQEGAKMPSGKDFIYMQPSALYCAGLADEFRSEILESWTGLNIPALASIDYVKLVSPAIIALLKARAATGKATP
jgi:hypothetical protein